MSSAWSGARHFLVVPAAGSGRRAGLALPKQFAVLRGKTVLQHTLECFASLPAIAGMLVALDEQDVRTREFLDGLPDALRQGLKTVSGGSERMHSVINALQALEGTAREGDWVLVHDAVRPCVRRTDIMHLLEVLADEPAGGLLAMPVRDTLKRADATAQVLATLERGDIWQAATPQMFRYGPLLQALTEAAAAGLVLTDEAAAMERLGLPVRLVQCHADNIKVTWPEDLQLAEILLRAREERGD